METNPYSYDHYDKQVPWTPPQVPFSEGRYVTPRTSQQQFSVLQKQGSQQARGNQKPKLPKPMPKARALALTRMFKKWLVVVSLVSFGTLGGLAAYHQVGTTVTAASTSSGSSPVTPASPSSSQNSTGFFNQQGGNNFGSNNASSAPVSGSHTS